MAKANYDLPEETLLTVMKLSGSKSKKEAIIIALESFLERKKLEELMKSPGKIKLDWTQSKLKKFRG